MASLLYQSTLVMQHFGFILDVGAVPKNHKTTTVFVTLSSIPPGLGDSSSKFSSYCIQVFQGAEAPPSKYVNATKLKDSYKSGRLLHYIADCFEQGVKVKCSHGMVIVETKEQQMRFWSKNKGNKDAESLFPILNAALNASNVERTEKAASFGGKLLQRISLSKPASTKTKQKDAHWQESLENVLANASYKAKFKKHLEFSFAEENLEFWDVTDAFMKCKPNERAGMYDTICEEFIKEGSSKQINLPSVMIRRLTRAKPEDKNRADIFDDSRNEVLTLMKRNFFFRFVELEKEREIRQQQMKDTAGSFAAMWRASGLDGFYSIRDHFHPARVECDTIMEFFKSRVELIEIQVESNFEVAKRYNVDKSKGKPLPRTTKKAIDSAVGACGIRAKMYRDFTNEIRNYVIAPLEKLRSTMASNLNEIHKRYGDPINEMEIAREYVQGQELTVSNMKASLKECKYIVEISKRPKKKDIAQMELLEVQLVQANRMLEEGRIAAISAESKYNETMLLAMDELESMELHRLDTQHQILSQAALAEQNLCFRLGLAVQGALDDAISMDSVTEIVNFAGKAGNKAGQRRPLTLRRKPTGQQTILEI